MAERSPLVSRAELVLHAGGAWALWIGLVLRLTLGYALTRHIWLVDSQLLAASIILTLLYVSGCVLSRPLGEPISYILGALSWLMALSLLKPYGWPLAKLPLWLLCLGAALLLAALVYRFNCRRRWLRVIRGRGRLFMHDWAQSRPFYARLLVRGVLKGLGFTA